MAKADIKKCPYLQCPFPNGTVDISSDDFVKVKTRYYHKHCFDEEEKERQKKAQENADISLILDLWQKRISDTVNFGYLRKILNEYLDRGIPSDYLAFVVQYVLAKKMTLRHPPGLRYYIDRDDIKKAYYNQRLKKTMAVSNDPIVSCAVAPEFKVQNGGSVGFGNIIKK